MNLKINKEVCYPCSKSINVGQPMLECENCTKVIHTRCFKSASFKCKNGLWMCPGCALITEDRYCPFDNQNDLEKSDRPYNEGAEDTLIQKFCHTLESCKRYSKREFTEVATKISSGERQGSFLSALFLNIDGNASNFDTFQVELKRLSHPFDVLGLAETNAGSSLQELYQVPSYTSFYQNTLPGKKKGTGVALYVSDSLNAVVLEKLSYCTVNIECLFAEITDSTGVKVVYGVVYRPPSGCFEAFCEVLQTIAKQLSGKPLRLLGDFNSDLFKVSSHNQLFEDTIISNGLYPSISIATHFRPNCKNSCIDNILVSDIDNVMLSGVLQDRLSEHSLIFSFTSTQAPRNKNDEKHVRYYDYSSAKLKNFVSELEVKVNQLSQSSDFCEFVDCFKSTLDKHCKLEVPKTTKRTPKLNPWITDGIILSIDRKHELCKEWSDTVTNKDPSGNVLLYKIFSDYRRMLKGIIKAAKRSYYCNEIYKNIESSKKTWQIINELRGKRKKTTKPPFIINNERILNRRAIANGFNSWFVSIAPSVVRRRRTPPRRVIFVRRRRR